MNPTTRHPGRTSEVPGSRPPVRTRVRPSGSRGARTLLAAGVLAALTVACDGDGADAYGNFEATEVDVSAERSGPLVSFMAAEGERLEAGTVVGRLDSVPLVLEREEIDAQRDAAVLRAAEADAQIAVVEAQLETAREDLARIERLYEAEAATSQQLVQARGAVRVLEEQRSAARARRGSAGQEVTSFGTRLARLADRLERSRIVNPVTGTVLASYVEPGEFVQAGRPLYTVAALDTLTLRAWISGAQLADVRLGQEVQVRIDEGPDQLRTLPGRVSWIASEAEFTPTPIQIREERVSQVYAVKVRVPNLDGLLKVGMPGELVLAGTGEDGAPSPGEDGPPSPDEGRPAGDEGPPPGAG